MKLQIIALAQYRQQRCRI